MSKIYARNQGGNRAISRKNILKNMFTCYMQQ